MKSNTKMKQAKQRRARPAPARTKRVAGERTAPAPIVVTDGNLDELCERLKRLPEGSPEYDRLNDALHRYMLG
jgi:hypothetical protein